MGLFILVKNISLQYIVNVWYNFIYIVIEDSLFTVLDTEDSDKEKICKYVIHVAQKLSPLIKAIDKTTRNIFQSEADVEGFHRVIENNTEYMCGWAGGSDKY